MWWRHLGLECRDLYSLLFSQRQRLQQWWWYNGGTLLQAFCCSPSEQLQLPCIKNTSKVAAEEGEHISHPTLTLRRPRLQTYDLPAHGSLSLGDSVVSQRPMQRQLNTMRLLALRRSAMTCQVCASQIFTLYCIYKMHLLYVIMLFEAHRLQDISSTSVFGQLIPSVYSATRSVIWCLDKRGEKKTSVRTFNHPTRRSSQQMQGQGWSKTGKLIFNFDQTRAYARRYIYLLPLQEFLLWVGQYGRDSQRNGSIQRVLLQPFLFLKTEELIALILLRISSSICSSAATAGWEVNQKRILY